MSSKKSFRKHEAFVIAAFIIFGSLSLIEFDAGHAAAAPSPFGGQQGNTGSVDNTTLALISSFQVLNVTFSNEKPQKNEIVNITIVLKNNGTTNLSNIIVTVSVDPVVWFDIPPIYTNVTNMSANETVELKLNWTAEPGSHAFLLKAKYGDITLVSKRAELFVRGEELGSPAYPFLAIFAVAAALVCALVTPSLRDVLSNRSDKIKDDEKSANKKM